MIAIAKLFRLLGVDSIHGGSPLAKMEDYGEAVYIKEVLQEKETTSSKRSCWLDGTNNFIHL